MKRVKAAVALGALAVILAGCALFPPIPIGPDALGFTTQELVIILNGTEGSVSAPRSFPDIDPPSFPIAPRSFRSVEGFQEGVTVETMPLGSLPESMTLSGNLRFTVSDRSGTPEPVTATVDFGPLELRRVADCTGCNYRFADPEAAARALTFNVGGTGFRRLLEIITEGQDNSIDVILAVSTDAPVSSISLTIEVMQNYIGF